MVHGDDKGLVLPPNVAGYQATSACCDLCGCVDPARRAWLQVVIVPLGIKANSTEEDKKTLAEAARRHHVKNSDPGQVEEARVEQMSSWCSMVFPGIPVVCHEIGGGWRSCAPGCCPSLGLDRAAEVSFFCVRAICLACEHSHLHSPAF